VLLQCSANTHTIDTDNQTEPTSAPSLDPRQGVFNHNGFLGGNMQNAGGIKIGVRSRLAVKALVGGHDPVHASGKEVGEPGGIQDLLAVVARRDDSHRHLSLVELAHESDRPGVGFDLARSDRLFNQLIFTIAKGRKRSR
jgi:hypothetical protein